MIVASFGYFLVSGGNIKEAIPIMGALSFSAVRLLPFAQREFMRESRFQELLNPN